MKGKRNGADNQFCTLLDVFALSIFYCDFQECQAKMHPKSLVHFLGRFFVAKYLTNYTCQDAALLRIYHCFLLFFMKPVNTTGAIKLMEEIFPEFRLPRDSYGVNDLGSYWSYMTWEIIVRKRKAFLKELMIYWKQILDKSLSSCYLPASGVQQNRGPQPQTSSFLFKVHSPISFSSPTNNFYTLFV